MPISAYNWTMTRNQDTGKLGEQIACRFLESRGYKVVSLNYRKPWGEIDVIAEKNNEVRFIEVKTVSREIKREISREIDNAAEERIDIRKLKKLARTATLYMIEKGDDREYQIDAVGITLDIVTRKARCRLYEQVIETL
jgi:putative endonuclease